MSIHCGRNFAQPPQQLWLYHTSGSVNMTLFGKVFTDIIKKLEMRLSWITEEIPESKWQEHLSRREKEEWGGGDRQQQKDPCSDIMRQSRGMPTTTRKSKCETPSFPRASSVTAALRLLTWESCVLELRRKKTLLF